MLAQKKNNDKRKIVGCFWNLLLKRWKGNYYSLRTPLLFFLFSPSPTTFPSRDFAGGKRERKEEWGIKAESNKIHPVSLKGKRPISAPPLFHIKVTSYKSHICISHLFPSYIFHYSHRHFFYFFILIHHQLHLVNAYHTAFIRRLWNLCRVKTPNSE